MRKIKKGDDVVVLAGKDKGKRGVVLKVIQDMEKVVVENINMVKRHQKPTQQSPKGGIIAIEAPVHLSNVALFSNTLNGPTKLSSKIIEDGGKKNKIRICRKTGEGLSRRVRQGRFR